MKKARFVFWWGDDIENHPFFNAPDGSTVSGDTLIERYGVPVPLFPSFDTWKREVGCKRRCGQCWAVLRGSSDLSHHKIVNHPVKVA